MSTTATQTAAVDTNTGQLGIEVVAVRPIEPKGKLIGYANLQFNGAEGKITIPDFPIFNGDTGLFVGNPSKQDERNPRFFRDTAKIEGNDLKTNINVAVRDAYVSKVQELQARAAAAQGINLQQPRIADQLAKAGQEADKANAARSAPQIEKPVPVHSGR